MTITCLKDVRKFRAGIGTAKGIISAAAVERRRGRRNLRVLTVSFDSKNQRSALHRVSGCLTFKPMV